MTLDTENTERNYLWGRLLAIAETAELKIRAKSENCRTLQLKDVFVNHPIVTWKEIYENLISRLLIYSEKNGNDYMDRITTMVTDIFSMFDTDNIDELNKPLDERYMIGYFCQVKSMM